MIGMISNNGYSSSYALYENRYRNTLMNTSGQKLPITPAKKVSRAGEGNEASVNQSGKVNPSECRTCKERKYVDGSNEGNVSFKAPGHIAPESSASLVKSHEMEHVSNAVKEGAKPRNNLVSVSVRLNTSICPECGRTYVSDGTTTTQIKYTEGNPYARASKTLDGSFLIGKNIDLAA